MATELQLHSAHVNCLISLIKTLKCFIIYLVKFLDVTPKSQNSLIFIETNNRELPNFKNNEY